MQVKNPSLCFSAIQPLLKGFNIVYVSYQMLDTAIALSGGLEDENIRIFVKAEPDFKHFEWSLHTFDLSNPEVFHSDGSES